jgi:hypothetical protein
MDDKWQWDPHVSQFSSLLSVSSLPPLCLFPATAPERLPNLAPICSPPLAHLHAAADHTCEVGEAAIAAAAKRGAPVVPVLERDVAIDQDLGGGSERPAVHGGGLEGGADGRSAL